MDIFSLIAEARTEVAKGSKEGRDKMLSAKKRTHGNPVKSRVIIYKSIMDGLCKGFIGQMFSTPDSDRIYVITIQKWGDSDEQVCNGRTAKAFYNFAEAKKYAARTLVRHGKSTAKHLMSYYKTKDLDKESQLNKTLRGFERQGEFPQNSKV